MTVEIQRLKDESEDLRVRMRNLERNYEAVIRDMSGFQTGMAKQDGVMQNLIRYFLGDESGE
jgi:osomolarity two-component system response regulator SKN7